LSGRKDLIFINTFAAFSRVRRIGALFDAGRRHLTPFFANKEAICCPAHALLLYPMLVFQKWSAGPRGRQLCRAQADALAHYRFEALFRLNNQPAPCYTRVSAAILPEIILNGRVSASRL
jgi:hypothetical protein